MRYAAAALPPVGGPPRRHRGKGSLVRDSVLLTRERTADPAPVPGPGRTPRPVVAAVLAAAVLAAVAAVLAVMRLLPAGSRAGAWRYRYVASFSWEMLLPFAGG